MGDYNGLVMILSCSVGVYIDVVLRIECGGLKLLEVLEGEIVLWLLLDGELLVLSGDKWWILLWLLVIDDMVIIIVFLQMIQEGKVIILCDGDQIIFLSGLKVVLLFIDVQ